MSFYRSFDMGTPAIRAIPAIPELPNSKLAGIARGLSPITRSLAMLAAACEGLPITPDELVTALGDDKAALDSGEISQSQLRAFAVAVVELSQRDAGSRPDGWTQATRCQRCGPVFLPPMKRDGDVMSCQWCSNRLAGFTTDGEGRRVEVRQIPRHHRIQPCVPTASTGPLALLVTALVLEPAQLAARYGRTCPRILMCSVGARCLRKGAENKMRG